MITFLTLWHLAAFGDFREKKRLNAHDFEQEFIRSGMLWRPGKSIKRRGKSSSRRSKKLFCLGGVFYFLRDIRSGRLLGHLGSLHLALDANR